MSIPNEAAPGVPAAGLSLSRLAEIYGRHQLLQDEMERVLWDAEGPRNRDGERACARALWDMQKHTARIIMAREVRTTGDIAITLAMASVYLDTLLDQMDDGDDRALGRSVATAIENATGLLVKEGATKMMSPELNKMIADACALPREQASEFTPSNGKAA